MSTDPQTTEDDRPVFPERLTRVAKAIWDQYPVALPAWDALPEYMGNGDIPGRAEFRQMARGALEAEGITIVSQRPDTSAWICWLGAMRPRRCICGSDPNPCRCPGGVPVTDLPNHG